MNARAREQMLKHIVMWRFKDSAEGASREENLKKAKSLLEMLKDRIPEIRQLEVGIDFLRGDQSYDLVLSADFSDANALRAYQEHPDHVLVVEFLRKVHAGKISVDYLL